MPEGHLPRGSVVDREALIRGLQAKSEAFAMMDRLEGWCTNAKASMLMDIVFALEPDLVVEVGVFGGKSLVPMAHALKTVGHGEIVGIDPWQAAESVVGMDGPNLEYWSSIDHDAIMAGLVTRLEEFGLSAHVHLVRATSAEAELLPNIDVLHLDGNHSSASAVRDVLRWVPEVRAGGIVVFDDVDWEMTQAAVGVLDAMYRRVAIASEDNAWGFWIKE